MTTETQAPTPPRTKPAAPLIDAFLGERGAPRAGGEVTAAEAKWLRKQRPKAIAWLGREPESADIRHFLTAYRSLGEHPPMSGTLRVVVVDEPGGPAMKHGEVVVVSDNGSQERNLGPAHALAHAARAGGRGGAGGGAGGGPERSRA